MEIKLPDILCTGCGACLQNCPVGAIKMQEYEDGFLYPVIDTVKCVQCAQCMKSCHALGDIAVKQPLKCFATQIKDKSVLLNSTSGGMFYALASSVINHDGTVYGCIFDENYNSIIVRADSLEQIAPIHGSKYVWSSSSHSYPLVKQDLDNGREVLYTCLPCQAAGLRKYLGKRYDNLFVVDVLCGGAPSPLAFQKYLETITDNAGKKDLCFQFRDKEGFRTGVNCTYVRKGKKYYETWLENSFYFAFSSKSRITWRKSCYGCNYKSINRVSDMTIGDYWGVEKHHAGFNSKAGVSVVLINTENGDKLFESVKNDIYYERSKTAYVMEKNSLVNANDEGHVLIPEERDDFFRTLQSLGWNEADKKFLNLRKTLLLKQKITSVPKKLFHLLNN